MRGKTLFVILSILAAGLSVPNAGAEAQGDGSSQTINSSETWSSDATLSGDVTVSDGGVLTIDSTISVDTGSSITVQDGGSLILNGQLNLAQSISEMYMEVYNNTILEPYFSGLSDSGTLRVNFAQDYYSSMNVEVEVSGITEEWTGQDYIDYNVEFSDSPINVNFTGFWLYLVWIDSIQAFDSNGAIYTLDADSWNHNNGVLKSESTDSSFILTVDGEFSSNGGTITGAEINCGGSCFISNSTLSWSAPIHILNGGHLSAETSNINRSRTYEDIIVHDSASIDYDTSTMLGTGGPTDMWIRLLSQRVIETNLKDAAASVHYEGLGYEGKSGDLMLDENGAVDLGENINPEKSKFLRMPEWVDSSGTLHNENASILITLNGGTTVWSGDYSISLNPAPTTPTFVASIELPYVVIDNVAPEDTQGTVNKGLGVMLTITNTGTVDVSTNIRCYEGSDEADMATIFVSLTAGQTKEVPAIWYANSSGAKSLNCKVSIPPFFNSLSGDLASQTGTNSELVSFKAAEDREDAPLVLYTAFAIVIIIATILFTRATAKKMVEDETEKDYESADLGDTIDN